MHTMQMPHPACNAHMAIYKTRHEAMSMLRYIRASRVRVIRAQYLHSRRKRLYYHGTHGWHLPTRVYMCGDFMCGCHKCNFNCFLTFSWYSVWPISFKEANCKTIASSMCTTKAIHWDYLVISKILYFTCEDKHKNVIVDYSTLYFLINYKYERIYALETQFKQI